MKSFPKATFVCACAIALASSGSGAQPGAAPWPEKAVTIVVPSAPGGASDIIARGFTAYLSKALPGAVTLVDNKAGAGGILGTEFVKKAAPDGYTFLISTNSTHAANVSLYRSLPYDPVRDFEPVGMFGTYGMVLLVRKESEFQTVPQLVEFAKSHPDKISFGYYSSSAQVPAELLKARAKVQYQGAAYKNQPQIITDLIGKHLDFAFLDTLSADAALQNDRLRAIAVTTPKRLPSLPDMPTVAEAYPGYEVLGWFGLTAPAKTPQVIIDRMNKLMQDALADPTFKKTLESRRLNISPMTPNQLRKFIVEDIARWSGWVTTANIERQ